jgi:mannose-6-phosphate isomerase-like protein (cupin superfamily)
MTNTLPLHTRPASARVRVPAIWLLVACVAGLYAQTPPAQFLHISKASLDGIEQELTKRLAVATDKTAAVNMPLSPDLTNHRTLMFRRDVASLGEIHDGYSDFGIVRSGSGSVRYGGTLVSRTVPTPGEPRGTALEGFKTARFDVGDLVYVPAGMPHQFVPDAGKHMTVMLFKPVGIGPKDSPSEFASWTAAQLNAIDKQLASKLDETRASNISLVSIGTAAAERRALIFHREGPGLGEIHQRLTEMALVRSGSGTVVLGGKVVDGKLREPGELFGPSIDGGTRRPIAAGDVVYVPEGTAHLFIPDAGSALSVVLFRFPSK